MKAIHFTATIEIRGVNPYVLVTKEQASTLKPDWKKPMPVLAQVNGQPKIPWKINMMPVGSGDFYLYLHGDIRKASKTKVGDIVEVDVAFDTEYQNGPQHPMPSWLSEALEENKEAKKNWKSLIPSRQKEILRYLARLKSKEAIERNAKRVLEVLSGKSERFMGRSWENGK
jgi:hypothetical protein